MIKERVIRSLNFWTSRMPKFFIGIFLVLSGFKHLFFAGSSFTAEFGMPLIFASIAGLPMTWIGIGFFLQSIRPRWFDPDYNLPGYPESAEESFVERV